MPLTGDLWERTKHSSCHTHQCCHNVCTWYVKTKENARGTLITVNDKSWCAFLLVYPETEINRTKNFVSWHFNKTTMMCQCLSGKDYEPHACCTVHNLSQNMLMANVAVSRINGVNCGLHASTESHSSSNISCDNKHKKTETTQVLPTSNKSQQVLSSALNRNTAFHLLEEDKSRIASSTQLIPEVQEHDINDIHTNSHRCENNSRSYTPREVFQHNYLVNWNEWSIYKGNIYDNGKVKDILFHLLVNTSKTRADKQHVEDNSEDCYPDGADCGYQPECNWESAVVGNTNIIQVLLKSGLGQSTVETCARLCRVGTIVQHTDAKYYEDLHYDIERLLNDLVGESCEGTLTDYTKEYMHLLQRWVKGCKSRHFENSWKPVGDVNESPFPLPEDVQKNPGCLRSWMEDWEPFDCCIPFSGAWVVLETKQVDLGNTHEIYLSTLRSHVDLTPFDTTVDGEIAWPVIPEDLFENDIMTEEQRLTESVRITRKYFLDPGRMERRRQSILQYFINKYKYNIEQVHHFLNWADTMKHGEKKFILMCNLS